MAGATAAAAGPTCAVVPPGADDVSVRAAAALCRPRRRRPRAFSPSTSRCAEMFAGAIGTSGATYTAVEAINALTATIGGA